MDTGQFFTGTIASPLRYKTPFHTHKGLCVRIGDKNEGAICFDTELLRISAGWTGPFLTHDGARFGLIVPPRIAGEVQFTTASIPGWSTDPHFPDPRPDKPYGTLPPELAHYRGLYLHGNRVVLSYSVGTTEILESPWLEAIDGVQLFTRTFQISPNQQTLHLAVADKDAVASIVSWTELKTGNSSSNRGLAPCQLRTDALTTIEIPPHSTSRLLKVAIASRAKLPPDQLEKLTSRVSPASPLEPFTKPGPPRWLAPIRTRGELGKESEGLAIDNVQLPFENPYRALMFVSGHDFFSNGDAAICTAHGDVWLVSGLDDKLAEVTWKRFATGLFQPLGLKIVDGRIYVIGRDQITRLHDLNQDGEADYYENFNNDAHVSTNGHEYVTCLETDSKGNFYYLKGDSGSRTKHDGCLLRVSPDGKRLEVFATGLRNANGLGMGPNDEITAAPQEGEWTPASGIFSIKQGGFYGAMQVHHRAEPPSDFERPISWLPRRVDNSSGGQVWVPKGRWGDLGGQLIHLSYGQCTMMLVMPEEVDGQQQAAVAPFSGKFLSGVMRGRFSPSGDLYVSGLRGWVTNSVNDGCFERVRYTGRPLSMPVKTRSFANGLSLTFSERVDRQIAEDPDNYQIEQWNYRWSAAYGSPELKPSQPNAEGRESVYVESASLLPDGRTVFLEIANLQPVWQLAVNCRVAAENSEPVSRSIYFTLHRVPEQEMDLAGLSRRRSPGFLTEQQRKQLVPGLLVRIDSGMGTRHREVIRTRTAVLDELPDAAASETAQQPYRVVMEGYVRPAEPGMYRLRAAGNGRARVFLNDQLVAQYGEQSASSSDSGTTGTEQLLRGYVPIRIEYELARRVENARFALYWQSKNGFEELIAPTALWCVGTDAELVRSNERRQATEDFVQFRCAKCHAVGTTDELRSRTPDGPSLVGSASRFNREWLARWLLAPDSLRNDVHMPRLLGDASEKKTQQSVADLVEFLMTLKTTATPTVHKANLNSEQAEITTRGEQLWEELGCIGCHRFTAPHEVDPFQRVSLHYVKLKYSPESLTRFLQKPESHYKSTRMPNFHLQQDELAAITSYILSQAKSDWDAPLSLPAGRASEGRKLAAQLRCVNCHEVGPDLPAERSAPIALSERPQLGAHCLGDPEASHGTGSSPRFSLTEKRRIGLLNALNDRSTITLKQTPAQHAETLFQHLRCNTCHARDGVPSRLPTIVAEEGMTGLPAESLPDLTWVGERIHSEWMEKFVAGELPYRPRPFLKTRMPSFAEFAKPLVDGLAAQHGLGKEHDSTSAVATDSLHFTGPAAAELRELLGVGYRLTLKDGGLDCRQCHGIGNQQPVGDDRTRIAPGINFMHVRERMRYDFFRRFVLDPPRYDLNTKMPKLSADGRTTNITHVFEGNASQQFDAIWHYLQTIRGDEP